MSPPLCIANFLSYCLQVLLLVVAGTALPALFRLRAPRVLLAYWQGLLLACLILPLLQPWRSETFPSSSANGTVSISFEAVRAGAPEVHAGLFALIAGVLLAGMLVRMVWLALGLRKLRSMRRAAHLWHPVPEGMRELETRLGVAPAWYLSPEVESPATFGIRPPSILLPQRFPKLDEAFQRAIAGHELLHVARRDWTFNLAEEFVLTVFWFHPAVAWVVNRIRLSREQAVDEEVVRRFSARKPYLNALLEIASGAAGPTLRAAPTFLKEPQLAHRIELLVKEVRMSKTRLFLSLGAAAGLLILAGVVSVWAFPLRAPAERALGIQPVENENPPDAADVIPPVKQVHPVYPPEAKKAGIQGIVRLRVSINKDGTVMDIRVLSGPPQLAKATLDAVQQWRYAPSEVVRVTVVAINFTLEKDHGPAPGKGARVSGSEERRIYSLGNGVSAPIPIEKPEPPYTKEARAAKLQGTVVLSIVIAADGTVTDAKVVKAFDQGLTENAVNTVKTWKFKPAMKDGKPVACKVSVEIAFKLF